MRADDKSAAVVVLPPVGGGRLQDQRLRRWLARSALTRTRAPRELLMGILEALALDGPADGLAALRMWGQTGDRPTVWIAAADPVYLEPRLDHLWLHSLHRGGVPTADLQTLFNGLQATLAKETGFGFARVGSYGYLRAEQPIATARLPAYAVDQHVPNEFMPAGDQAAGYRTLLSEIEMTLHGHEVNARREQGGERPVNSLWLWGGGYAPEQQTRPHPPLFADDPLLKGYWCSVTGVVEPWPGTIAACLEAAVAGFVAVTPELEDDSELLQKCLHELLDALWSGRLSRLTLMFRDGVRADVKRFDTLRFWRRDSSLLD